MTFSYEDLAKRAGVDPWRLRDKLAEGNPAEITNLAKAFADASGDAKTASDLAAEAEELKSQGYQVDNTPVGDPAGHVQKTKEQLGGSGEKMASIARLLNGISDDLETRTASAKSNVTKLEGEIRGIESDWNTFWQQNHNLMDRADYESTRESYVDKAVGVVKTFGATVNTLVSDYEVALMGHLKRLADLGYVPPSEIDEGPNVLDLPLTNADGEQAGGINPDLPTDLATLQKLLDAARANGLDPQRYAALLQQYWLVKAANDAGIDLNAWDPQAGVDGNRENILKVYGLYGKFFLEHPELQWAGMANMIGPSFAGGFMDLDSMEDFSKALADKINSLPGPVRDALPPELKALAEAGRLGGEELSWFENKFLAMQKHIFMDQGSMHEAYLNGGTQALDEMRRAGLIDGRAMRAWEDIGSGDPQRIEHGNGELLYREQNQIIDRQYDQMREHHGVVGQVMTYGMTVAGDASIPGTKTPGEFSPLDFGGRVTVPGLIADTSVGVDVDTPLPDFNVSNQEERWRYVTQDTLPAYQKLLHEHPDQARQIIASPLDQRIEQQRLSHRWPELAEDLLTNWSVHVDGDVDFHWPW